MGGISNGTAELWGTSRRIIASLVVVVVASCQAPERAPPNLTSYPVERFATQETTVMMYGPLFKYKQTEVGDKSEHEIRAFAFEQGSSQPEFLKRALRSKVREKCGPDFRLASIKYYNGTEATSKFLNTRGPWMSALARCPIANENIPSTPTIGSLVRISKTIDMSQYFDVHEQTFSLPADKVWTALKKTLADQRFELATVNDEERTLVTEYGDGLKFPPVYEKIAVVVEDLRDGRTTVAFRYLQFYTDTSEKPWIRVPNRRDFVFESAKKFLEQLNKVLGVATAGGSV